MLRINMKKIKIKMHYLTIVAFLLIGLTSLYLPRVIYADVLQDKLVVEIDKMLSAGHLKPGFFSVGLSDQLLWKMKGDSLMDYFHNPADTIWTLIRALPYLPSTKQTQVRSYIQNEYNAYPLTTITHVGWKDGSYRDSHIWPPEMTITGTQGAGKTSFNNAWTFNPFNFYAAAKYAKEFGGASSIFNAMKSNLATPPADSFFTSSANPMGGTNSIPSALNIFIAGYMGYLELESLAGAAQTASVKSTLDHLVQLRMSMLDSDPQSVRGLEVGGFMYLVPELGQMMHDQKLSRVQTYVDTYQDIMPYWFVAWNDNQNKDPAAGNGFANETAVTPLYAYQSLFAARAYVLKQSRAELEKYIDVPAFEVGDLFFIQNLIATLEAGGPLPSSSPGNPADADGDGDADTDDFKLWIGNYAKLLSGKTNGDFTNNGKVNILDYAIWIKFNKPI